MSRMLRGAVFDCVLCSVFVGVWGGRSSLLFNKVVETVDESYRRVGTMCFVFFYFYVTVTCYVYFRFFLYTSVLFLLSRSVVKLC